MDIGDQSTKQRIEHINTEASTPAPTSWPQATSAPAALSASSDRRGRMRVSQRAGFVVAGATFLHQLFLQATSASAEGVEVAAYVTATSTFAFFALFALMAAALVRVSWLPQALASIMAVGLIAQAACPIDGHVSVTDTTFMLQTVSWLGYGMLAVAVFARTQMRAEATATA